MREIKFRAWDTNEKKWYCMEIFRGGHSGPTHKSEQIIFNLKFDESIVLQQYTGLKDKEGKDIYEGDIVKLFEGDKEVGIDSVNFYMGCFNLFKRWNSLKKWINSYDEQYRHFEVIGNIYETPELL